MKKDLIVFYYFAKKVCIAEGFKEEIQFVEGRKFDQITSDDFFREYAWVVISSGISNKAAISVFRKLMETRNVDVVKHPGKNKALKKADCNYLKWFGLLQACKIDEDKIKYIQTLPYMGPATSYHFARNLGIDCAKPDRHLKRIAWVFDYTKTVGCNCIYDVQGMCKKISEETGDRIGTVDVILWRYCVLKPQTIEKLISDEIAERTKPAHAAYVIRNRLGYSLKEVLKHPSPINAEIVKYVDGVRTQHIEYNTLTEKMYKPIKSLSFLKKGGRKQ